MEQGGKKDFPVTFHAHATSVTRFTQVQSALPRAIALAVLRPMAHCANDLPTLSRRASF